MNSVNRACFVPGFYMSLQFLKSLGLILAMPKNAYKRVRLLRACEINITFLKICQGNVFSDIRVLHISDRT